MIQLAKNHQKQISKYNQQIQFYNTKIQRLNQLENIIDQYKDKINDANKIINKINDLQNTVRSQLVTIKNQQQNIQTLNMKLQKNRQKINIFQQRQIQFRLDIQRKNIQISEFINKVNKKDTNDDFNTIGITIHRTLSQQCPEILNNQTENLWDTNKTLRGELERTTKLLKNMENQLSKYKLQSDLNKKLEQENKKLTEILKDLTTHRGQQNQFLVGCLYQLRMANGVQKNRKQPPIKPLYPNKKILGNRCLN